MIFSSRQLGLFSIYIASKITFLRSGSGSVSRCWGSGSGKMIATCWRLLLNIVLHFQFIIQSFIYNSDYIHMIILRIIKCNTIEEKKKRTKTFKEMNHTGIYLFICDVWLGSEWELVKVATLPGQHISLDPHWAAANQTGHPSHIGGRHAAEIWRKK